MHTLPGAMIASRQFDGISNEVGNVKHTLSSWDACMSKAYCKWPVIAAIIIVSLIVISILTCIIRCACCGAECCCGCLSCCNACCPSPRRSRRDKYDPAPQHAYGPPPPAYGYQPQPGMNYGPQPAQFASFESSGARDGKPGQQTKYNEDSLPAMPSWANARERKVEDETPVEEPKDSIPLQDQKPLHDGERDPMLPAIGAMPRSPSRTASPFHSPNPQQSPFHPPPSPYGPLSRGPYGSQNNGYPVSDAPSEMSAGAPGAYAAGAYAGGSRSPAPHQQLRSPGPYAAANNGYGYPTQPRDGAMELPDNSPSSPVASSVYTTATHRGEPAPSYHTQAPMPAMGGAGYVSRQDSYSRPFPSRSPPQQYGGHNGYSPYAPPPSEMDGGPSSGARYGDPSQQSPFHQPSGSWGQGPSRKPIAGSWREV